MPKLVLVIATYDTGKTLPHLLSQEKPPHKEDESLLVNGKSPFTIRVIELPSLTDLGPVDLTNPGLKKATEEIARAMIESYYLCA